MAQRLTGRARAAQYPGYSSSSAGGGPHRSPRPSPKLDRSIDRGNQPTPPVVEDMKWFLLFLLMTMIGFSMAFYALYRQDRTEFTVSGV